MRHDKDYIYDPKGLVATASTVADPTRKYFFQDHLGTTRVITNQHGITTGGYHSYYPYGEEIQHSLTTVNDRMSQFTGHEREAHGHADYMLGRHCSYRDMRFLSVDPGRDGWNLYAYVGGNPLKYVDPTGQERAGILFDQDARAVLSGEISEEQFKENVNARASGAIGAASLFVPGPEDVAIAGFLATKVGSKVAGAVSRGVGSVFGKLLGKADEVARVPGGAASVDDLIGGAKPGRPTKGPATQFEKPGGVGQARRDFDALSPTSVKDIPRGGQVGQLPDGRTVVVRPASSGGPPTLEIQAGKNRIKIRYEE